MLMPICWIRSIPACAGEPPRSGGQYGAPEVYPRVCGGTCARKAGGKSGSGLSPRVRGNRGRCPDRSVRGRSIPACAGEPGGVEMTLPEIGVYPRVCGGTDRHAPGRAGERGLSPRVRGNPTRMLIARRRMRSIPACAGEPVTASAGAALPAVYPRVCGGTRTGCCSTGAIGGLSPRVRGNRTGAKICAAGTRSIPACAGEPLLCYL